MTISEDSMIMIMALLLANLIGHMASIKILLMNLVTISSKTRVEPTIRLLQPDLLEREEERISTNKLKLHLQVQSKELI